MTDIKLYGRVFIKIKIKAETGLHIGGSGGALEIGGVNNEIIRNPLNNQPYIPGSSLRGKMRSLTEKRLGLPQNNRVGNATIHVCQKESEYTACEACQVFGVPAELDFDIPTPTRLIVRDIALTDESVTLLAGKTELYSESKTEVVIDRVTSAAVPRELERVPAGAEFGPSELVFGVYAEDDLDLLQLVFTALQIVEDDYLGGSGSRGSGKIKFADIEIAARSSENYSQKPIFEGEEIKDVQDVLNQMDAVKDWVAELLDFDGEE